MWDAQEMGKRSEDSPARSRESGDEELQMALDLLSRDAFELGWYGRNKLPDGGADE
jgi:Tfp pilus assembly protein PilW